MLSKQDLDAAIAECLATDKPTKSTCVYLAAFQAVREQFFSDAPAPPPEMSFAAPAVDFDSDSDFAAAYRRDPIFALNVADELIDTLSVTNPAIYRSVIRKLQK